MGDQSSYGEHKILVIKHLVRGHGGDGGSSPKTGASRPWIGYRARAKTVKKEILAQVSRESPDHGE